MLQVNLLFSFNVFTFYLAVTDPLLLSPGASLDCQLSTILAHGMDITDRTPNFCTEFQERELLVSLHKRTIGLYNNIVLPESGLDKLLEVTSAPTEVYKIKGTQYSLRDGQLRLQDFSLKNRVYRNLDGTIQYDATGVQLPNFVSTSTPTSIPPNDFGSGNFLYVLILCFNFVLSFGCSCNFTSYFRFCTGCSLFFTTLFD